MFVYVACMLKTPISLVYKGISSKIRVCCASFVNSIFGLIRFCIAIPMVLDSNTYDIRLQYLCFQAPIPMILERKTIGFRNGSNFNSPPFSGEGLGVGSLSPHERMGLFLPFLALTLTFPSKQV